VTPLSASREEVVARARELAVSLRARAAACEAARRLPRETIADLGALGLTRLLRPAALGGLEADLHTLARVGEELARGCASTAWCLAIFATTNRLVGLFPEAAQREVWRDAGDVLAVAVHAPSGTAVRAERGGAAGFRVGGRWRFASGCEHASWAVVTAVVQRRPPGPLPDVRGFLVPASDARVEDTWFAAGLRGSGSHDLVVPDAFVPAHRVVRVVDLVAGRAPGAAVHGGPLYRLPVIPTLALAVAGPAVGLAREAIEQFRGRSLDRRPGYAASVQATRASTHARLAGAIADVDAASLVLERAIARLEAAAGAGPLEPPVLARARLDAAWTVAACARVVDALFADGGAAALLDASPIQRGFRDVHAIAAHAALHEASAAELYGRLLLGLPADAVLF
jgi:3-hydroxy-9,10-secoandrosta-1,3,5(10)-triene-9,17-dione monooxygenase